MNRCGKLLSALGVSCLIAGTAGGAADNPYRTVVDRNPFGLNPPPPVEIAPPPTNPPPKINITGITGKGENRRAWFMIPGKDPKDTLYVNLAEKQRQDALEVLEIRDQLGEVKIKYGGMDLVLNFKDHANKASAGPAGAPAAPAPISPAPGARPTSPVAAGGTPASPATLAAPAMVPQAGGYQSTVQVLGGSPTPPPSATAAAAASRPDGLRSIPTRTLRLSPGASEPSNTSAGNSTMPPLTIHEQATLMQVNEHINQDKIRAGVHPPFPPLP